MSNMCLTRKCFYLSIKTTQNNPFRQKKIFVFLQLAANYKILTARPGKSIQEFLRINRKTSFIFRVLLPQILHYSLGCGTNRMMFIHIWKQIVENQGVLLILFLCINVLYLTAPWFVSLVKTHIRTPILTLSFCPPLTVFNIIITFYILS